MSNDATDIFDDMYEPANVTCVKCESSYTSDFDENTGVATTPCYVCGHDQRDYLD